MQTSHQSTAMTRTSIIRERASMVPRELDHSGVNLVVMIESRKSPVRWGPALEVLSVTDTARVALQRKND